MIASICFQLMQYREKKTSPRKLASKKAWAADLIPTQSSSVATYGVLNIPENVNWKEVFILRKQFPTPLSQGLCYSPARNTSSWKVEDGSSSPRGSLLWRARGWQNFCLRVFFNLVGRTDSLINCCTVLDWMLHNKLLFLDIWLVTSMLS